jgi:hypothetical protein
MNVYTDHTLFTGLLTLYTICLRPVFFFLLQGNEFCDMVCDQLKPYQIHLT